MLQDILTLCVTERDITQLNLLLECCHWSGILRLLNRINGFQDKINAVHRGKSLWYLIGGSRELFQRVNDAIEDNHIEDKGGGIYEVRIVQNKRTAKPQHYRQDNSSQELTHRMSGSLTDKHSIHVFTVGIVCLQESFLHLPFCYECLYDAQTAQSLVKLSHNSTPLALYRF